MAEGIAAVLSYAVGVAISPIPIIAVGDAATDSTMSDSVSWIQIVFGVLLLVAAVRQWRTRPWANGWLIRHDYM